MIHPSYVELMRVVNDDVLIGEEPVVNSRYSIVCATAKRARQLINGSEPLHTDASVYRRKPLSIAVEELYRRELRIITQEEADEKYEKLSELKEKNHLASERCRELKKSRENVDEDEDVEDTSADTMPADNSFEYDDDVEDVDGEE